MPLTCRAGVTLCQLLIVLGRSEQIATALLAFGLGIEVGAADLFGILLRHVATTGKEDQQERQ